MAIENAQGSAVKRVLIALDCDRGDEVILEMAASLAAHSRAELVALFIQDVNLAHMAGLPFVHEVDRISATVREFDEAQLARAMRMQTEHVRRSLARISERSGVRCTVQVMQGRYTVAAAAAAREMDILFLARPAGRLGAGAMFRAGSGPERTPVRPAAGGCICVIYNATERADRALELGAALANDRDLKLVVVSAAVPGAAEDARRAAEKELRRHPGVRGCVLATLDNGMLPPAELQRSVCHLILMPRDLDARIQERISRGWRVQEHCSIVLIP